MVQEFHVLRCCSCHTFQVHQVKKSKKWACKLCGEKQSLIKVYGQGSAADCRHHVQKLNLLQGEVELTANTTAGLNKQNEVSENDYDSTQNSQAFQPHIGAPISCWSKYLEEDRENSCVKQDEEEENSLIYTDQEHFYTQRNITSEARKRKKMPQNTCHFKEQDFNRGTLYTSKKKRTCEEWVASEKQTDNPYYITNENLGSTGGHEKLMSPATDQPTCSGSKWERYISAEEEGKEHISRTHIFQNKVANIEPTLNKLQHKRNIGLSLWTAQKKTSLESELPRTVQEGKLLSDQSTGCVPMSNDDSAVGKPQCSIFQTDEDFDENY